MSFEVGVDTKISKRNNHHGDTFIMFSNQRAVDKEAEFSLDTYEMGVLNILGIIACLDESADRNKYLAYLSEHEEAVHDRTVSILSPVSIAQIWLREMPKRPAYKFGLVTNHGETNLHYDNDPGIFYVTRSKDLDMERINILIKRIPDLANVIVRCEASRTADEYYKSPRAINAAIVHAWGNSS